MGWVLWVFPMFLFFLVPSRHSLPPQCHPQESSSLLAFKTSFIVTNVLYSRNYTASWDLNKDCCSWSGVICDEITGHVVHLDVSYSGLEGIIDSNNSLFSLTHLRSLYLAANDFKGSSISPNFGRFPNLLHLDLSYSNFSGHIPHELAYLSNLLTLDLTSNNVDKLRAETSSLKRIVANLTRLKELNLGSVNMFDVLPGSLMNLSTSLIKLRLRSTKLQGRFPENIFRLPNLEALYLYNNQHLTGSFPQQNWTSQLKSLDISNSGLQIDITYVIQSAKKLKSLSASNASNTKLSFPPPSFSNITWLNIINNNLGGQFPWVSLNLPKMITLVLSNNNFKGQLPYLCSNSISSSFIEKAFLCDSSNHQLLGPLPLNIECLMLNNNSFEGTIPTWLYSLPNLKCLNLGSNHFTGHIGDFHNRLLLYVNLQSNQFNGHLPSMPPSTVAFFASNNRLSGRISSLICNHSELKVLDLANNSFSGSIFPCLRNFSNALSVLDLRMNNFDGIVPSAFSKGISLRTLNLNGNQLEGPLPRSLLNAKSLEVLDVGNNKLNGSFPQFLESLPELRVLVLRSNKFHGLITNPKIKFSFQNLRIVDLSNNKFTGVLPAKYFENFKAMIGAYANKLEYLEYPNDRSSYYQDTVTISMKGNYMELERIQTMFTTIDLSGNNFIGTIPKSIGKLDSLKGLMFSHNKLTGALPSSLGDLSNIEWLDLSSNELVGEIPQQLASNLYQLGFINLSNNNLVGRIPQGTQFATFSNDSYKGNLGLCGFPLTEPCSNEEDENQEVDEESGTETLTWKLFATIGYGVGIVIGVSVGYFSRRFDHRLQNRIAKRRHSNLYWKL